MASSGCDERDQHPSEIEPRQPERRLRVDGLTIRGGRGVDLLLTFEDLPEVVVRAGVTRVDGDRLSIGVRRVVPLCCRPSSTP